MGLVAVFLLLSSLFGACANQNDQAGILKGDGVTESDSANATDQADNPSSKKGGEQNSWPDGQADTMTPWRYYTGKVRLSSSGCGDDNGVWSMEDGWIPAECVYDPDNTWSRQTRIGVTDAAQNLINGLLVMEDGDSWYLDVDGGELHVAELFAEPCDGTTGSEIGKDACGAETVVLVFAKVGSCRHVTLAAGGVFPGDGRTDAMSCDLAVYDELQD